LAIDAWKLFNPADPPRAGLFDYCGVRFSLGLLLPKIRIEGFEIPPIRESLKVLQSIVF